MAGNTAEKDIKEEERLKRQRWGKRLKRSGKSSVKSKGS